MTRAATTGGSPSKGYLKAVDLAIRLQDDELIAFHRYVSRLARAAYGRQPRYQENYRNSMPAARAKREAARRKSSAGLASAAAIGSETSEGQ